MNIKLVAAVSLVAAGVGFTAGGWRSDAACLAAAERLRDRIETLVAEKHDLELAIAEANREVAVAAAETRAADAARAAAEKHAADLAAFSESRLAKLQRTFETATSCDEVLRGYWEIRK